MIRNLLCLTLLLLAHASAETGKSVRLGGGSYSLERPSICDALPKKIFKTAELTGATPTNQWWSSLVWEEHSQNMFPHPLGMVCHAEGLGVSYPGSGLIGSSGHIMGGGVTKTGDFFIGHSATGQFPDARLAGHSAWFITAEFRKGDAILRTSLGHGSPFIFCEVEGGSGKIQLADKAVVWSGEDGSATLGLTVRGNHYGLFGPTGSRWIRPEDQQWQCDSDQSYFSIALLPDKRIETLALFQSYAHNHVTRTEVKAETKSGQLETSYQFETEMLEGQKKGTLFALYPHQWKYSPAPLTGQSYRSVRGEMKLAEGEGFITSIPIQGLLPMLPPEGIPDRERMVAYLKSFPGKSDIADTYWEGKHLGTLATLSGIAEVIGEEELQGKFVSEIRERLENWFTASPGEEAPLFYYDKTWGTLIGSKASYGSDSQLNDHHFHYGYFIRAAAEVARLDPAWAKKWGPMVNLLIRDIASSKQDDPLFPHLRCFDIYAGHSWASGHAKFGDGNNQESSSESMNAWYSMMLWGEATGDDAVRDLGTFLYNTERTAVEEYWFDVGETNFPKNFPNVALGMIWGGKGSFSTWFSADIDCIHGINWLPFTPASISMGRHPDYVKKNHDFLVSKREGGTDYNNGWGDLIVMFNALSDPESAAAYLDKNPDCSLEGGNTHAFMYHWLNTLDQLGRNDARVTADHPFTNVFLRDGKKTYAAYNFSKEPLKVRFSDGFELTAAPQELTLRR